jgi:hypothetical protein
MNLTAILLMQLCSLGVVTVIVAICFLTFHRKTAAALLAIFTSINIFGFIWLEEVLRGEYQINSALRWVFTMLAKVAPPLMQGWSELISWLSPLLGACAVLLALAVRVAQSERDAGYLRGTKLLSVNGMQRRLARASLPKMALRLGSFKLPKPLETRAILLAGEPGTGKTQLIIGLLLSAFRRNERAIVFDAGGDLCSKLSAKDDYLLSVSHHDGLPWSPFGEIRKITDCAMVANALIPEGVGESRAWIQYARELLATILQRCYQGQMQTNESLLHFIRLATRVELEELVKQTSSQRLFEPGNDKMLSNVLSILSQNLSVLSYLDPMANEKSFSIRAWVASGTNNLWIPYEASSLAATASIRAAWIEILSRAALDLEVSDKPQLWIVLDELAANGKIEGLDALVSRGRKYGVIPLIGIQNKAQLDQIYGRDLATSILSSTGHRVVLRTPDPDTADYLSRTIGDQESRNKNQTFNSQNGGTSTHYATETKRLVMASEIAGLPDRQGYLKVATVGWVKIAVPLARIPKGLGRQLGKREHFYESKVSSPKAPRSPLDADLLDEI